MCGSGYVINDYMLDIFQRDCHLITRISLLFHCFMLLITFATTGGVPFTTAGTLRHELGLQCTLRAMRDRHHAKG